MILNLLILSSEYSKANQQIKKFNNSNLSLKQSIIQQQNQTQRIQKKFKLLLSRRFPESTITNNKDNVLTIQFQTLSKQPQQIVSLCNKSRLHIISLQILTTEKKIILKI